MKRLVAAAMVVGAASFALGAPVVSSQEKPDDLASTTSTSEATATTSSTAPTTTTTEATTESTTTTTAVPAVVAVPPVLLFGEAIAEGTLGVDVRFEDDHDHDCATTVSLGGGQMNRVSDPDGNLGLVYGQTATGSGTAAVMLMELGVIPAGVGILSIDDATCRLDAMGVGLLAKAPGSLSLEGIGIGVHPDSTTDRGIGQYVEQFDLTARVGATAGTAQLDVASLRSFLQRPRPGITAG